jgi:hypothetical protein
MHAFQLSVPIGDLHIAEEAVHLDLDLATNIGDLQHLASAAAAWGLVASGAILGYFGPGGWNRTPELAVVSSTAARERGGTGRRAGFRSRWGNPWGFESPRSHSPATQRRHCCRVEGKRATTLGRLRLRDQHLIVHDDPGSAHRHPTGR